MDNKLLQQAEVSAKGMSLIGKMVRVRVPLTTLGGQKFLIGDELFVQDELVRVSDGARAFALDDRRHHFELIDK